MDINIDMGFDPFAFLAALVAVWFAWHESRRSNRVLLRVEAVDCSHTQSIDENRGQLFSQLRIRIRNLGLSLHTPKVSLSFRPLNEHGRFQIPLAHRHDRTGNVDEFARGMVADFGCKSYECDKHTADFFDLLKEPTRQDAFLCVYSQGYLAKEYRIGGVRDRIISKWNRFAFWFNGLFTRITKTEDGKEVIRMRTVLPSLVTFESKIMEFVQALQRRQGE